HRGAGALAHRRAREGGVAPGGARGQARREADGGTGPVEGAGTPAGGRVAPADRGAARGECADGAPEPRMTPNLDIAISEIEDEVGVIEKCDAGENDHVALLACLTRAVCLLVRVCAER